nr:hypothetical protein Iba_chr02bCG16110 [Ipomoea batatas]
MILQLALCCLDLMRQAFSLLEQMERYLSGACRTKEKYSGPEIAAVSATFKAVPYISKKWL